MLPSPRRHHLTSLLMLTGLMLVWGYGIFFAVAEEHQGAIYRILYVHVPAAAAAFIISLALLIQGIMSLKQPQSNWIFTGKALAEVGLLFTSLTLITGSLWGRPTWGVWWSWDARMTTTLLLALLYMGYLLLWNSVTHRDTKVKVCGILAVLIAVDVPIIYQSVTWWRTLHQPPSLFRSQGSTMDLPIQLTLLGCTLMVLGVAGWLTHVRTHTLKLKNTLEQQAFTSFR